MTKPDTAGEFLLAVALVIFGIVLGAIGTYEINKKCWQAECVRRGYAEHSAVNGRWQWKDAVHEPQSHEQR